METTSLIELARQAIALVIALSAPAVLTALGVGLVIGLLQAASQVQEFTLSFVPKILAVLLVLLLCAPWMGAQLVRFARAALAGGF